MRKAFITGITGQDGSYLTELLLAKGYHVHGLVRRASSFNTARIDHLYKDPHERPALELHHGDVNDASSLRALLERIQPDEVYNLAAQSHVRVSFDLPVVTADSVALGTLKLLEAVRDVAPKHIRFYQAGSSEMFGGSPPPQSEHTPFRPRSPYACGKVFAHHAVVNYREAFGMFAVNGILFNHESPRRGETFLTRKVTRAVGRIKLGLQDKLYLGTLEPTRDWGYAGDYVEAMWRMLQQGEPDDYVVATGESHSVGEWVEAAFAEVGLPWQPHVERDDRYLRPTEVEALRGDPSKAHAVLGWKPKVGFRQLVRKMVVSDLKLAERERLLTDAGHDATPAAEAGQ
jgi:GDPmannose 4,6-dehydratase